MAVSTVMAQAGVISTKYVPLGRFFRSIRNGPSTSGKGMNRWTQEQLNLVAPGVRSWYGIF